MQTRMTLSTIDALSIRCVRATVLHGHRQVTDAYLLALATTNRGRFATLDQSIPIDAVPGANTSNLVVI